MIGYRLVAVPPRNEIPQDRDGVFYATESSASTSAAGLSADKAVTPWVAVDSVKREIRTCGLASLDSVAARSLWFNVAMLGLLQQGGLMFHAAGAELCGRGLLILGVSGAGKSTLSALLDEAFPKCVLCDERIAVLTGEADDQSPWQMMGSPWESSAGIARRKKAPLSALIFLEQAPKCEIFPIPAREALQRILPLVSIDWKEQGLADSGVASLDRLLDSEPAYVFRFTKTSDAARFLAEWVETKPRLSDVSDRSD